MKKLICTLIGLGFAATAAHAQPAAAQAQPESATPAEPATPATAADPGEGPATPAEPATPATPAAPAAAAEASFTEAQIDAFAAATVKVQAIDADAAIAADQKQAQMRAAVTEAGLDAATYNKIGKAIATDTELRSRVQVAMSKHAGAAAPSDS